MASSPSIPSFQAPSGAPSFAWTNPADVQNAAMAGDVSSYNASDADFAARYPGLVSGNQAMANNVNANQQAMGGQMPQAAGVNSQMGSMLGTQMPATQAAANGMIQSGNAWINQGQTTLAQAQPDIAAGQNLISGTNPLNPLIQQQMMTGGLQSAAGALGSGNLASGSAGQAAVAANLGNNIQNYIAQQQNQGMALQNTGSNLLGAGAGLANTGTGMYNSAANQMGAMGGLYNNYINNTNSLSSSANQQSAVANSIMQPRTFGIGGAGVANTLASDMAGANNMAAFLYGSQVQGAQLNTQIAGANSNAAAQASGQALSAGVGVGTTVATTAATIAAISCWVARTIFGEADPRWKIFRFWMLNIGPKWFRKAYLTHGKDWAVYIKMHPRIKTLVREQMQGVINRTNYVYSGGAA